MTRNQAILRALSGKLNLGVLGATVGASALLQSSPVLLLGLALFFGLFTRDVYHQSRRVHCFSPKIPDASSFHHIAVRNVIDGIGVAQRERIEAVSACPDDILRMLDGALHTAVELERSAVRIARRTERMYAYLSRKDIGRERELLYAAELSARHARTADERFSYEAAARSCALEVETLGSIELGMRVAIARLENIRATLAVVPPRIVKLCAAGAEMGDQPYLRLSDDLLRAGAELQEIEERFRTMSKAGSGEASLPRDSMPPGMSGVRVSFSLEPVEEVFEGEETPRAARTC